MVDPLSVIALGITVSQGFIAALSSWKSFEGDKQAAVKRIEDLNGTLSVLSSHLTSFPLAGVDKTSVEEKIVGCQDGIKVLDAALAKLRGSGLISTKGQRVIYPFKKDGFKELGTVVTDLQQRLGLALQVYQCAGIATLGNEVKVGTAATGQAILNLQTTVDDLIDPSNDLSIISNVTKLGKEVEIGTERTGRAITKLQDTVGKILEPSNELSFVAGFTRIGIELKTGTEATGQAVATLQGTVDNRLAPQLSRIETNTVEGPQNVVNIVLRRLEMLEMLIVSSMNKAQGGIDALRETRSLENNLNRDIVTLMSKPSLHKSVLDQNARISGQCSQCHIDRDLRVCFRCEALPRRRRPRARKAKATYSSDFYIPWARRSITLSMGIGFGAGGQGIGFGLTLRGRVCEDSPAFQLIKNLGYHLYQPKNESTLEIVEDITERLRYMIVERQISVWDVNVRGDTLMHVLLYMLLHCSHILNDASVMEAWEACIRLIEILVQLGVPMNETNLDRRSPLLDVEYHLDLREYHHKRLWESVSQMGFEAVGEIGRGIFVEATAILRRLEINYDL